MTRPAHTGRGQRYGGVLLWLFVSFAGVAGVFSWQGMVGLNLWDEGFLWYGAQRVLAGEVPILDFMAYDPARYYWSATAMQLLGDAGIGALRVGLAGVQVIALFLVLDLLRQHMPGPRWGYALGAVLLALVWMVPRHKLFDVTICIALIAVFAAWIDRPTLRHYALAGLLVGFSAVVGRNHGVYGLLAAGSIVLWLAYGQPSDPGVRQRRALFAFCLGMLAGFSPVVLMALTLPGFAGAFLESIVLMFARENMNLPLPVPWPWEVDFVGVSSKTAIEGVLRGLFFLSIPLFVVAGGVYLLRCLRKGEHPHPVLAACIFLAPPYAHYAFSRADEAHLAQGIWPCLIAAMVWTGRRRIAVRWTLLLVLTVASVLVMRSQHPGWICRDRDDCSPVMVSDEELLVQNYVVDELEVLEQAVEQFAADGQSFLVVPFMPGAYAVYERKAPNWEIYALVARDADFQQREIERIKRHNPVFVLVMDYPLDDVEALRFRHTNPLIYRFIRERFALYAKYPGNVAYELYVAHRTNRN